MTRFYNKTTNLRSPSQMSKKNTACNSIDHRAAFTTRSASPSDVVWLVDVGDCAAAVAVVEVEVGFGVMNPFVTFPNSTTANSMSYMPASLPPTTQIVQMIPGQPS